MSVASDIDHRSELSRSDRDYLVSLVDSWHLLADLSFSDLILWVPDADDNVFWAVAQIRPATGPTALESDVIGDSIAYDPDHLVTEAYLSEQICSTSDGKLGAGIPVDVHAVPIVRHGSCIGIVERHTNRMGVRAPGALEDAYLEVADILSQMLWQGDFPFGPVDDEPAITPRVGDGMIRLTLQGKVTYVSPNALTAYRHMGLSGDLEGENFYEVTRSLLASSSREPVDSLGLHEAIPSSIMDIENKKASLRLRILPLREDGVRVGTIALCRDTTELRSRERELVTKDATIREIHHRVKNNLQTVAALLRLQARRITSPDAKVALEQAMARVAAIAVVHEILSQAYDDVVAFDSICDRILSMVGAVASTNGTVHARREGSFEQIPGDVATHLALVVTELCQNAVEHGLRSGGGEVVVRPIRNAGALVVEVHDNGSGIPEGFEIGSSSSLGLSIVQTLVTDLKGTFELSAHADDTPGSVARVSIPAEPLVITELSSLQ
ncbi:MAG: sensor histidine kinase [Propionibacteriaceae bacterium]